MQMSPNTVPVRRSRSKRQVRARRYPEYKGTRTWGLALNAPLRPCCGWLPPPALPDNIQRRIMIVATRHKASHLECTQAFVRSMTPQQHLGVAKLVARCDTIPAQQRITPTTRCHKTAARASRNIIILCWTTSGPPKPKLNGTKPRVGNDSGTSAANDVPQHRPHDSAAPERRKRIVVQKKTDRTSRSGAAHHTEQYQAILRSREGENLGYRGKWGGHRYGAQASSVQYAAI